MFWPKKKPSINDFPSDLLKLATQLGVERRQNVRVRYSRQPICKLPVVGVNAQLLKMHDISVGGCALYDPEEVLGSEIGRSFELELHWTTGPEKVLARIVARVDNRRHIQFLDLSPTRQLQLRRNMTPGVRGSTVRRQGHGLGVETPGLMAAEIWSSLHGDSVVLENDVHRIAQLQIAGDAYLVFKSAWPMKPSGQTCSKVEFEQIVLFLTNVPKPSPMLEALVAGLEELLFGRPVGQL
jgi:hypothetical protein